MDVSAVLIMTGTISVAIGATATANTTREVLLSMGVSKEGVLRK